MWASKWSINRYAGLFLVGCALTQAFQKVRKPALSSSSPSFLSTNCRRYGLYLFGPDILWLSNLSFRSLADTQDRGVLDLTDFTIAMYLIQATMSNQLSFIPTLLPPGLYEQAGGAAVAAHATGSSAHPASPATSPSFPAPPVKQPSVQTNFTGQPNLAPTLPSRRPAPVAQTPAVPPFPSVVPQATGLWDVTPAEKTNADRFFDNLDSHKRGYIEGDVAVPFMLQSKLPEDVLAQIWCVQSIATLWMQSDSFRKGSCRHQQRRTFDTRRVCGSNTSDSKQAIRQGNPGYTSPNPRTSLHAIERPYFTICGRASSTS